MVPTNSSGSWPISIAAACTLERYQRRSLNRATC